MQCCVAHTGYVLTVGITGLSPPPSSLTASSSPASCNTQYHCVLKIVRLLATGVDLISYER